MTKFETIGSTMQMNCETICDANQKFEYSCKVCCLRGVRIECERCAIRITHEHVLGVINDVNLAMRGFEEVHD